MAAGLDWSSECELGLDPVLSPALKDPADQARPCVDSGLALHQASSGQAVAAAMAVGSAVSSPECSVLSVLLAWLRLIRVNPDD